MYQLGKGSLKKLKGIHPDLAQVVKRAIEITLVDFTVLEGLRSKARQEHLVETGKSQTMKSRHLTGHAVDLGAWVHGTVEWDWALYEEIAKAMKHAAMNLNIDLKWGGDWKSFKDGPHFQLSWEKYPA